MKAGEVSIELKDAVLGGELSVPPNALGLVLFAHGSGSSRHSPRNQYVAGVLRARQVGTLLFDLLTAEEEQAEAFTRHLRFNIVLLANRLTEVTRWTLARTSPLELNLGYFGSSTGAAAALTAAAGLGAGVRAVVSRGGRPDLASDALPEVTASTLLIVGGDDTSVIPLNEMALGRLRCEKGLRIVAGATHLFEEPGTLEIMADLAADWFVNHLRPMPVR